MSRTWRRAEKSKYWRAKSASLRVQGSGTVAQERYLPPSCCAPSLGWLPCWLVAPDAVDNWCLMLYCSKYVIKSNSRGDWEADLASSLAGTFAYHTPLDLTLISEWMKLAVVTTTVSVSCPFCWCCRHISMPFEWWLPYCGRAGK